MSSKAFTLCFLSLIQSTLLIINGYAAYTTKIYPYMQISMDIGVTTIPLNCSTIFSIGKFLSISITSHNILQLQIENNPIHNHPINLHTTYTLNITLNPSNNHYSLHPSSNMQTNPFKFTITSSQYTISHPLTINDNKAQINNLVIVSDETESNGYLLHSSSINNNKIFANIANNGSFTPFPTAEDDKYQSIFGPNVTEIQEIIFLASILVAIICILSIIAYATVKKCNGRNINKCDKQSSYEKINVHDRALSRSVVNYVNERPGNHDVNVFKDAEIPLTQKKPYTLSEKDDKISEQKEGEGAEGNNSDVNVGVSNTLETTGLTSTAGNDSDDDSVLTPKIVYVEREESISAMNI